MILTTPVTSVTNSGGFAQFNFSGTVSIEGGQQVTLSGFSEGTYNAIVNTVTGGSGSFVTSISFAGTDTGSFDSLTFTTENIDPDTDQEFINNGKLTVYGEEVLFTITTALDEIRSVMKEFHS